MRALAEAAALEVTKWTKLNWHSYMMVAKSETRRPARQATACSLLLTWR
jgi:hypothetical protein